MQSLRNIPGSPEVGGTAFAPGYARLVDAANKYGAELVDITPTIPYFFDRQIFLQNQLISKDDWPSSRLIRSLTSSKKHLPGAILIC